MIINSLLDTDFYKLTMGSFAFHFNPEQKKIAEYSMKCRSGQNLITLKKEIEHEIENWLNLTFLKEEIDYLRNIRINDFPVFKEDYLRFLQGIDLKNNLEIKVLIENNNLNIRVKGDWKYSIFAEVPILAIVQELYWKTKLSEQEYVLAEKNATGRLLDKIIFLNQTNIKFAEFGTRRRFSLKVQNQVVTTLKEMASKHLLGTSNVLLAKQLNLSPIGSMAHEFFQAMQVLASSFSTSQKEALSAWLVEYPHNLKIALSDILGVDMFLLDFDYNLANEYDGVRQDSGDPIEWGYKIKKHYDMLNIETKNKTLLFSDDLNFEKANAIEKEFDGCFNVIFGIGTFCSNDTGNKPVSLVMKMVRMNNLPVVKISDSPGKEMCEDLNFINNVRKYIDKRLDRKRNPNV